LCEEDEKLDLTFERLDETLDICKHLFYISFTHHTENRFGGGNYSDNVGLKRDGELLLEYMSGKKIAVDLSHASDNLAYGIINYIDKKGLDIPVIASHSNFRPLCDHVRNLPDDLTKEIVSRNGLIGMNFMRDYIHPTQPAFFIQHILNGLKPEVAIDQLAFGADFFYLKGMNAPERLPLFFPEHGNASKYPEVLNDLEKEGVSTDALEKLAYKNALNFIDNNW
jgi:microsomal dipeptidase-like Zn-dependent dipeptidase